MTSNASPSWRSSCRLPRRSRFPDQARLAAAQAIVSAALAILIASVAAVRGVSLAAFLALLVIPLDALMCGSRRSVTAACAVGAVAALVILAQGSGHAELTPATLQVLGGVAIAFVMGHALAQAASDRRVRLLCAAALRAGEAREGETLRAIDDLVTWHDRSGSVLRATSAATTLVGVAPTALCGQGLFARIHVPDRPAFLKAISDAANADAPAVARVRLKVGQDEGEGEVRSEAATILVEMRAHRLDTERGAAVVVTRDISEHAHQADALEAIRREAQEAKECRARLLATVSHELRTPLNALIGYSELLAGKHGRKSGEQSEYGEMILRTGRHMLEIVNGLLDLSAIEAGGYDLAPEAVNIAELVTETCRFMSLTADRAEVALVQDVGPDLPELRADRRACQQILINLLSNAVKFTPPGGLVTVEARRDGERVAMIVKDTGIGVSAADLPRLGSPFYRASSGRGRGIEGSGLGLSVVRGLVGLHQGRIGIASAPGNGTSVTVSLPIEAGGRSRGRAPAPVQMFENAAARQSDGTLALKIG